MKSAKDLRQKLGEMVDASRKILDRAQSEQRKRTAEEEQELSRYDNEMDQLDQDISRAEKVEAREQSLAQPQTRAVLRPEITPGPDSEAEQRSLEEDFRKRFGQMGHHIARRSRGNVLAGRPYRKAYDAWLVAPRGTGISTLTPEEQRALSVGVAAEGGYTVPQEEFVAELIKEQDNQSVLRGISRAFQVPTAQGIGAPTLSADPSDPDWTTELETGSADSTMAFGKRELHPWPLAKSIKVSDKLLRASPLGMETIVRSRLAYKNATAHSAAFNTGTGVNRPLGIYTASASGIPTSRDVEIGDGSAAVNPDKLIEARYTLRQGYWPNAKWHFHRNWLRKFRQLQSALAQGGNYLWQPGLTTGAPSTLLDFPYVVDEYAPSVTTHGAGVYAFVLGDFSNYWIVDALSFRIQRLDELYAATNQVGFIVRSETDAAPVLSDAFVRGIAAT